MIDFDSRNFNC